MIWIWSCNWPLLALHYKGTAHLQAETKPCVLCGPPVPGEQIPVRHVYLEGMNHFTTTKGASKPTVLSAGLKVGETLLAHWGRQETQSSGKVLSNPPKFLGLGSPFCKSLCMWEASASSVVQLPWTQAMSQTQVLANSPPADKARSPREAWADTCDGFVPPSVLAAAANRQRGFPFLFSSLFLLNLHQQ